MIILGLDPGGTTGLALYNTETDRWIVDNVGEPGETEHHGRLWDLLRSLTFDVCICESFEYRRKEIDKGVAFEIISREYIGLVKLAMQQKEGVDDFWETPNLYFQNAATGKGFWTDDKLKQVGVYEKTNSTHQRDAVRHVLHWLSFTEKDDRFIQMLRPAPS
jgi:hypothetical protein